MPLPVDPDRLSAPERRITRRERTLEEKHKCRLCHLKGRALKVEVFANAAGFFPQTA
jgi:hypothetical protein